MAKNNKKSFASRAKDIQNKYKRASFDPIEAADMEAELEALMAEQEQVRASMGLADQEQMACGGKMKYPTGGFMIPTDLQSEGINFLSNLNTPMVPITNSPTQPIIDSSQPTPDPTQLELDKLSYVDRSFQPKETFWDKNRQYLPYALSGLSNMVSNAILANMAKKNQPTVSAAIATPEMINLEPKAEALRGRAGVAKNVALTNARNVGVNPVQALASMSAAGTDIDRNLGEALTNLYMQQEGANVGAANQFALDNQAAQNRADMMNIELDYRTLQDRLGYTGAALGTIPGVMKDIRMDKADKEMRDIMDRYYQSTGGRHYLPKGSVFKEGSFTYEVIGHREDGEPIIKKKNKKEN